MEKKIFDYIEDNGMIEAGDTVIVGVSGGADSVCLLLLLNKYKEKVSFTLKCAHVNHMIRETAARDEEFVRALCERLGVELAVRKADIPAMSKESGLSEEETGRNVRYEFMSGLLGDKKGHIAVAHHMGDVCETMLFNLFRGTGISGLAGIRPVTDKVIRPLLCVTKEEIEEYLTGAGMNWMHDETNDNTEYSRNRIRHLILPEAVNVSGGAVRHMAETAGMLAEVKDFLDIQTAEAYERYVTESNLGEDNTRIVTEDKHSEDNTRIVTESNFIEKNAQGSTPGKRYLLSKDVLSLHPALRSALIHRLLVTAAGRARDISTVQVRAVETLLRSQVGKRREFIYGLNAERVYDGILLSQANHRGANFAETQKFGASEDRKNDAHGEAAVRKDDDSGDSGDGQDGACGEPEYAPEDFPSAVVRRFKYDKSENIPKNTYTKWFDYGKINSYLLFRKPKEGDYLTVNGSYGRKLLKDYFVNEKVPRSERADKWVLADGSHILWIPGMRISEYYKVSDATTEVIEITLSIGEERNV